MYVLGSHGSRLCGVLHLDPGAHLLAVLYGHDAVGGGRFEPGSRRACAQNATNLPVGNADDLNGFDGGVGIEELLNLARVHVLSAADDDVLAPAHDLAEAVLVEH
jgi:hypothetical protein